jgi:hypothetical protein
MSVLMPCRNAGSFLRKAAASVLQQPQCLELLVAPPMRSTRLYPPPAAA